MTIPIGFAMIEVDKLELVLIDRRTRTFASLADFAMGRGSKDSTLGMLLRLRVGASME